MHPEAERWNRKYAGRDGNARLEPDVELVALLPRLAPPARAGGVEAPRALDIACGTGANALALAGAGWRVVGLDVSIEALRIAADTARRCGRAVDWVVADALDAPFGGARFDLIVGFRFLERQLFRRLPPMLTPGGHVVWCTFNEGHLDAHPGFNPRFVLGAGELPGAFPGCEIVVDEEGASTSLVVARRITRD